MSSLMPEHIRNLLSQHRLDVEPESISEDLSCIVCGQLMIDAYQTLCDCRYCRRCIIKYIDDGNAFCRGDKEDCREELLVLGGNVHPSAVLNKKILKVKVRCPNEACEVFCKLTDLEEHLRVCNQQPAECPYLNIGCGNRGGNLDSVEAHLLDDAFAHARLLAEVIDNLRNEVGGLKDELRSLKEEARLNEIVEKEVARQNDVEVRGLIDALRKKLEEAEKDRTKKESQQKAAHQSLQRLVDTEKAAATKAKAEAESLRRAMEASQRPRGEAEVEKPPATSAQTEPPKPIVISKKQAKKTPQIGQMTYTMGKVAERLAGEAGEVVDSPHFYSHLNGYKLRLRVEPVCHHYGLEGHLTVHLVVCKGEADDQLPWPCRLAVTVSVLNQRSKAAHATEMITYDSIKPAFADNPASGWILMVPHDDLKSACGVVLNNTLQIHVVVGKA